MKNKYDLKCIFLYPIMIAILVNISIGTLKIMKNLNTASVFLQQESNSNVISVNRLIKNGNIVKKIREEEELGEIIIDDDPVRNQKERLTFFRTLGLYSIGADVKELNTVLYYLGYGANRNSRVFSVQTERAVKTFQQGYHLRIDGFAGKYTINTLNNILKEKQIRLPDCEPKIQKVLSNDYWIVINKDANLLKLYKGRKLIKKYSVATGKKKDATPEGKFKIKGKTKDPYWGGGRHKDPIEGGTPKNPLGTMWLGLDYGGGRWYGIHGTNNPRSIGKHVSNGCIRMHNRDVEELGRIVSNNTIVFIGNDKQLNRDIYRISNDKGGNH
jgi:hypothetical protein